MEAIELRPYQSKGIHQVFDAWRGGARSVVMVAPTGSGKRIQALWLMDYAAKAGRRVLFVGNRRLLITQAQNDADKFGLSYGTIMADAEEGDPGSTNQLASIQTLESWYFYEKFSNELTGRGLPPCDLCIVDEAHQEAKRYRQLLELYPDAKFLLLTATPVGPEGRSLVPSPFDVLVEPVKNSELIAQGHLLRTTVYAPSEPHIQGVQVVNGKEYNQSSLGRAVRSCTVFADVFREWEPFQDRATVCFVPGVAYGRDLVDQFNHRLGGTPQNPKAYLIEAKTKTHEREEILAGVREGRVNVLVSVDVLKEGADVPVLSCGLDLQPNSQLRTYWQKLGRIKRPYGDQRSAAWLDFAGNYWRFPHPDEDPQWPQGEETTQESIERSRADKKTSQPISCPKCNFVRQRGPTCPSCGYTTESAIRRIRMEDGSLVEVPAVQGQAKEITQEERLRNAWKSQLFAALKSGRTYSQAAFLFHKKMGEYPKHGWPGTFPKGSMDWKRRPTDHFDAAKLIRSFL